MSWRGGTGVAALATVSVLALLRVLSVEAAEHVQPATAGGGQASTAGEDFPRPPSDPAAVARGKQVFSVNCSFCHGSDARGGEGGPNLLRSPIVLNDRNGEAIYAVMLAGRVDKGMPKFNLTLDNAADIAAYVHSIPIGRGAREAFDPKSIVVGDATAGRAYFYGKGHCSQCHSLQGDFAHIGSRFDPKTLQDNIVSGAAATMLGAPLPTAPPRTVTITLPSGEVIQGNLISIDDFNLSLTDAAGNRRTLPREGDRPRVEIKNPMQAHLDMLRNWEDRDIHNLTAFLVKQQ
ncbi:MAG TPA: c-type cytochrome [Steroidobacteraceae bacterium]|nr:c-type cytochrome [Steroidobacteraceae bacterium]